MWIHLITGPMKAETHPLLEGYLRRPGPPRIVMLGSLPPIRALSSYCLEFACTVAQWGRVQFISFKKIYPTMAYPGGDLKDDHSFPTVTHPHLSVNRRLTWYNPVTWFMEGFLTRGDLLHAQWWSFPLSLIYVVICLGFKLRQKPIIFTVHNVLPHERTALYHIILRILFKFGDHFIVHSAPNRLQLIKHYYIPSGKVTQIPHGPLDFHVRDDVHLGKVREEMGFGSDEKVILVFGAIRPYKGLDTALRAFARILSDIPEARLLIAGKLWESWDPYQRLIDKLGIGDRIKTCLEYIPSGAVWKYFEASDLVILPYEHFDSQSGVGATAISFRKPMIVTDVGGLPELVKDRRYVVPSKDPAALAGSIVSCFQDPNKLIDMSSKAEEVAEKMAWSSVGLKTWSIYAKVLGHKMMVEEH
jgi:glycosyltransferase involved in cell wall biosynthesis